MEGVGTGEEVRARGYSSERGEEEELEENNYYND